MSANNEPIIIRYAGREYWANRMRNSECGMANKGVSVGVCFTVPIHRRRHVVMPDEEAARRWLCDNGLRKSKAKKLLAAVLRNEGDFADPEHPHRVRNLTTDYTDKIRIEPARKDFFPVILNRL